MHVRALTINIHQGKMQEAIGIVNNEIVPATKAQKGFQGLYVMTNAASGKILAIAFWDTEADMMAVETGGPQKEFLAKIGSVMAGPATQEHYELSVEASA